MAKSTRSAASKPTPPPEYNKLDEMLKLSNKLEALEAEAVAFHEQFEIKFAGLTKELEQVIKGPA